MMLVYTILGLQTVAIIVAMRMIISTSKVWHWTFHTKRTGGWLKICGHCALERLDGKR